MRGAALCLFLFVIGPAAVAQSVPKVFDASVPRETQIELARGAAPKQVSDKASVYVLTAKGYEKAISGSNGFTCLVSHEVPGTLEPECHDAEGTRTVIPVRLWQEELRVQGKSEDEIKKATAAAYASKKFRAPSRPGMAYMMSPHNRVFDPDSNQVISFPPHLMFYAPYIKAEDLGGVPGNGIPYIVNPGEPDALIIVVPETKSTD
jgi:hypothetical protein